jgi:PHD/YefM family antitoxin component YafN of YafNO toxin-antitoxin module
MDDDRQIGCARQYLVDEQGKRLAVLIPIEEYESLMELVEDHNDAIAGDRAVEESEGYISLDDCEAELRRDGLL